jgi:hypothetical protein
MNQLKPSTAASAYVCTQASCIALGHDCSSAGFWRDVIALSIQDSRPEDRPALDLDAMCMAAQARVQQGILRAAGAAYMALDIPPPDSHLIDVLMCIPGLAGIELTDDARGE